MPKLHPFNETFAWQSSPLSGRATTAQQVAQFDEDGFLLYEGASIGDQEAIILHENCNQLAVECVLVQTVPDLITLGNLLSGGDTSRKI